MTMRVRVIATGETIEIREAEFYAGLHERIAAEAEGGADGAVAPASGTPPRAGDLTADQLTAAIGQAAATAVTAALEAAGVGRVDRSRLAVVQGASRAQEGEEIRVRNGPVPARFRAALRATPVWEGQYRSLPADVAARGNRTPQSDYMVARWLRALVDSDHATLREIEAWDVEGQRLSRAALAEGAATTGGNLVPSPLANEIVELLRLTEAIGPRSRRFTSMNQKIEIPTQLTKVTAAGVLEAGTMADGSPTFGQVDLTKRKSFALVTSSYELLADSPFNIVQDITEQAAEAFGLYNDTQDIVSGNGTPPNQTSAILVDAGVSSVDAAVGALAYADVTALFFALLSRFRAGAVWLAPNNVIQFISNLLSTDGRPVFQAGTLAPAAMSGGQGSPGLGTLLGLPILEVTGQTAGTLVIGNLRYYGVLQEPSMRVEVSRDAAFTLDQILYKFVQRRDGAVLQGTAFKKSAGITS